MTDAIDTERSLGALVRENLAYAEVFESEGIDYCCGGDVTLQAACQAADIEVEDLCERLTEARRDTDDGADWETHTELVEDIISTHHQYLREELPVLEGLVRKVARVHGENHPELRDVKSESLELTEEMKRHIDEEEAELFPIIEKLDRGESLTDAERETIRSEIEDMEVDHEETATRLENLSELTDGYAIPEDACASYQAMLERLEALEIDTHRHVHKENNVLFAEVEQQLLVTT